MIPWQIHGTKRWDDGCINMIRMVRTLKLIYIISYLKFIIKRGAFLVWNPCVVTYSPLKPSFPSCFLRWVFLELICVPRFRAWYGTNSSRCDKVRKARNLRSLREGCHQQSWGKMPKKRNHSHVLWIWIRIDIYIYTYHVHIMYGLIWFLGMSTKNLGHLPLSLSNSSPVSRKLPTLRPRVTNG